MVVISIYYIYRMNFPILFCVLIVLWSSNGAIDIGNNNYDIKISEQFLKNISHHYCDRLTGTHVVLLAEKSAASFYKVLQRSFHSTFYVHSTLVGYASLSDLYNIIFIEDETFFFDESIYDRRFWHTTKTYLIVSENKLKNKIIWPHIKRIWETFKVFKISLLSLNKLKVLRIFNGKFYKYATVRKLNYGVKNVKQYPLRVVIFPRMPSIIFHNGEWTGPDWKTLQAFSKRMNFALKISFLSDHSGSAFGERLINGSYTGVLGEVVYDRADVSFNSRFLNDPMIHKPYHYTRNNGLDYICFIVPKAETLTRLQILWMTFTVEVWLCLAVTYALMTKSFQLFNKLNLSGGRKISDPFMTSLQVVLGMGVCSLPKHVAGRIFFVSCSVACFVMVILFQASMVTKLSTETSHKEIDTLEELDKSGMEIRTSLRYVRDALAIYSTTKSLANKIDLEKDRQGYIASKFVFIARIMNLSLSKYSNFIGHFGQQGVALHIVRECPLKYYLTYAIAIDFPFLDELNDLLTRFQEAGITYKWKTDIQKLELVYYEPLNPNSSKGLKAYSLNDLWFAFVFLFVGYILSFIALMLEFILKKLKK